MGICRSYVIVLDLKILDLLLRLNFSILDSIGRFIFMESSLLQNFVISFLTLSYVPLDE